MRLGFLLILGPILAQGLAQAQGTAGGAYGQRLLQDFFVHNVMGAEPPEWNR